VISLTESRLRPEGYHARLRPSPIIEEETMAETARMAVFHGAGKPFEIREYPVPDPEPGAILIKVAMANVCGSTSTTGAASSTT
jgi:hypothetical protein